MSNKIKSVSEIKAGMLLLVEGKEYGVPVREYVCVAPARIRFDNDEIGLAISGDNNWFALENFNEEFSYAGTDVIEVWSESAPRFAHKRSTQSRDLLWSRQKAFEVVEMTVADVEKLVGKKVKIVK